MQLQVRGAEMKRLRRRKLQRLDRCCVGREDQQTAWGSFPEKTATAKSAGRSVARRVSRLLLVLLLACRLRDSILASFVSDSSSPRLDAHRRQHETPRGASTAVSGRARDARRVSCRGCEAFLSQVCNACDSCIPSPCQTCEAARHTTRQQGRNAAGFPGGRSESAEEGRARARAKADQRHPQEGADRRPRTSARAPDDACAAAGRESRFPWTQRQKKHRRERAIASRVRPCSLCGPVHPRCRAVLAHETRMWGGDWSQRRRWWRQNKSRREETRPADGVPGIPGRARRRICPSVSSALLLELSDSTEAKETTESERESGRDWIPDALVGWPSRVTALREQSDARRSGEISARLARGGGTAAAAAGEQRGRLLEARRATFGKEEAIFAQRQQKRMIDFEKSIS